ncbi:MAG TPA: cysteine--tRNA ligase [Planctomycetes bacterium]|nr:cysteine--tRNA ligase [Planctomycetota bacterium]
MTIRVYNTLTKSKEPFEPLHAGKVGIYLCGPTVYKPSHIGHMVGPVIFDTIKRYLVYNGYQVNWVVNITDVDDKLIAESQRRGISMPEVAEEMTTDYLENLQSLNVRQIDAMPKATDHIAEIVSFIEGLIDKNFAYAVEGDVFFEVSQDSEYGKLSNRTADSQQGTGGEASGKKRSPGDFALWKAAKAGEPSWESPWGAGRPGWHIECSAMSHKLLGTTFDIHGGGLDLVFPHHENELAQSECCHGQPMVKYWMHNGLMRAAEAGKLGGRSDREEGANETENESTATKISRSEGAGGLAELIGRQTGERIRFFLLRTHYRSTIVFSEEGIEEAGTALESFTRLFERMLRIDGTDFYQLAPIAERSAGTLDTSNHPLLEQVAQLRESFLAKMDDDFNTGAAGSDLFELVRELNKFADQQHLDDPQQRDDSQLTAFSRAIMTLRELTSILGLFWERPVSTAAAGDQLIGQLVELFIELRKACRDNKDFTTADNIRDGLTALGITLEDRPEGTGWRLES